MTACNGKIVSVGMAKMNLHGPQSAQISNNVIPQLEQQTLAGTAARSTRVSGATYTSRAYAASLQAALVQAQGRIQCSTRSRAMGTVVSFRLRRRTTTDGRGATSSAARGRRGPRASGVACARRRRLQHLQAARAR